MGDVNFADLDPAYGKTPPELVGMYPLGGGGLLEAPYRHYFELSHLRRLVKFDSGMNVLELGSGNGRWASSLAPRVAHYSGVDLTRETVALARATTARHGIRNVDFHEMSVVDFKGDRPYDVVYFSGVSQYLEDGELATVLDNLSPWLTPATVIVDRSTISHRERQIDRRPNYFCIMRTPGELGAMFARHGFALSYCKRSYRFLRGARFLRRRPLENILPKLVTATRPVSLHLMRMASALADFAHPRPFEGGNHDHVFMLFHRAGS